MARTLQTAIQKRFSDIDPFHHVNNVSQQMYFDVAKVDFYDKVIGQDALLGSLRILTVSTSTSYIGQVRMTDDVQVTTTCEKVGNKSITLFQQILCNGEPRTQSRSVMVAFDFDNQIGVTVPDQWRERLIAQ